MKKYYKLNGSCFAGAIVCILINTVFAVVLQFFKGDVLDYASVGNVEMTLKYVFLLIAFILCEIAFYYFYRRFAIAYSANCLKAIKSDVFESIINRSFVKYIEQPQGHYISKYSTEANTLDERCFQLQPILFEIVFKIVFVSAALFLLDWRLAIVTIFLLTTPLYLPKLIEKQLQRAQSNYIGAAEESLVKINDWLSGFEVIKNFSVERGIFKRFKCVNDNVASTLIKNSNLNAAAQLITMLISYVSYFIVLFCAAMLVLNKSFTPGDFFVAIGMIDQLSYPLISLSGIIRQLIAVKPTSDALISFINESGESGEKAKITQLKKSIKLNNVSFGYVDKPAIINNFSAEFEKNKHYLIQGKSGTGKTTLINLLLNYYKASSGEILLDDCPAAEVADIYATATVVRQEATLFNDSLKNNLTMFAEMSDEKLIETLNLVGLGKFASKQALSETVEQNGTNFSGGEKKRICLARALLRNTDIYIFDEPLANLDEATLSLIEDVLLAIKNKLVIIVSHQFSTEKLCKFSKVFRL